MLLNPHKYPMDGVDIEAHNAMAAMLRCRPGDSYALAPFAPLHHDGQWWVAAVYGEPEDGDDTLLIDGKTGAMRWLDDDKAVGFWGNAPATGKLHIYSNGIVMARAWAAARQDALERAKRLNSAESADLAHMPGLAMIGDPARIGNFADIATAHTIEIDNPRLRHVLADAMLRAARLPVVVAAPPPLKVVASNGR